MYTDTNFKTKKALNTAVLDGERITVYQPGGQFPSQTEGKIYLEGPHYPKPHTWYAQAIIRNGVIVSVK